MADRKILGQLTAARYGFDSDGRFGLQITLRMADGLSAQTFHGTPRIELYDGERRYLADLSSDDYVTALAEHQIWLIDTMFRAKKRQVEQLAGTPIEVVVDDRMVKSWRVLTEVL